MTFRSDYSIIHEPSRQQNKHYPLQKRYNKKSGLRRNDTNRSWRSRIGLLCRNRAPAPDTCGPGGILDPNSSQALPQHMNVSAYGCFLPDLTGFADAHCEGPNCQHCSQVPNPASHNLKQEFNLAIADCELQGTATSPSSTVKLSIDHSEAKRNRLEKVAKRFKAFIRRYDATLTSTS